MQSYAKYKIEAVALRRSGKTYTEIQEKIGVKIPPSTLCMWFQDTSFSPTEKEKIALGAKTRIRAGHLKTLVIKKAKREKYFQEIQHRLTPLADLLSNTEIAKLTLMMLYWCEGSKHTSGCVQFGNSDPRMIKLFLTLMRKCYPIDENKFRGTVQCRADQNPEELAVYWSEQTDIPLTQFYHPQIDLRTLGKPSKKISYKGVMRIDYFSSSVYHEFLVASKIF